MRRLFADGDNTNFNMLKNNGFTGVAFEYDKCTQNKILSASECNLEVWILLSEKESISPAYLLNIGGRLSVEEKAIDITTSCILSEKYSDMDENSKNLVTGFIVPFPNICGIIWDDSLESECDRLGIDKNDNLIDLFDEEPLESTYRAWYYEQAERLIIEKYLLPLKEFAESYGKKISFDMGAMETQYDLAYKMANPFRFMESGIAATFRQGTGLSFETEAVMICPGAKDFSILTDCIEYAQKESEPLKSDILLIKPSRGVMERFVMRKRRKYRLETPALIAAMDGTYYINMLKEKGFNFHCADEFGIERYGFSGDGKFRLGEQEYGQILICQSCRFSQKGINILKKAEEDGVCINSESLIKILGAELEE